MASPYFQKFKGADNDWHWRLRAANNETVASGEGYQTEQGVDRAIQMLQEFGRMLVAAEIRRARLTASGRREKTRKQSDSGGILEMIADTVTRGKYSK